MSGFGDPEHPYVENPIANWVIDVHWRGKGRPGVGPKRTQFGLIGHMSDGAGTANGSWTITDGGPKEPGTAVTLWGGVGLLTIWTQPSLISNTGSPLLFFRPFASIAAGDSWSMSLTLNFTTHPFLAESFTLTVYTVVDDGSALGGPGAVVLATALALGKGESDSVTVTAAGVAPL